MSNVQYTNEFCLQMSCRHVRMNYALQHYLFICYYLVRCVNSHTSYKTIVLEDPAVCSEITKRVVKFDTSYAINLTQSRLSDHSLRWATSVNCNFRLYRTSKHAGIIVVIQELMLRRNESTGDCIDYIQFKTQKGRISKQICGVLDAKQIMNLKPNAFDTQAKENTFISDHNGHLDVFVYISKNALRSNENTKINIIFTLFNYCTLSPIDYESCLNTREICIHKNYFYDGIINCPFFGCVDEGGCNVETTSNNTSVGSKVLIGSAASLALIFMIFIVCLYICRKYRKFCWSEDFSNPNNTTQTTRVIEMNETSNQPPNTSATAPTLNEQEDKDLPPSYESLFPSR